MSANLYGLRSSELDDQDEWADRPAPGKVPRTARLQPSPRPARAMAAAAFQADARTPLRGLDDPFAIHLAAQRGVGGAATALPHAAEIQRGFGHHDVSGVQAHVGGPAADAADAIGAGAYAYGDHVAFAGAPDLRQAAHEAAHVVQQRGGVRLDGGVGRAGDVYEQHADVVAAAIVRGESAEALLDTMAHRGAAGGAAVQRLTSAARTAAVAGAASDLTLEQLAHRIAYLDAITDLSADDRTGLTGMGFDLAQVRPVHGEGDLQFWVFPRLVGDPRAHTPVIAFRGSSSAGDLAEDGNPAGIGMGQFTMNQALIQRELQRLGAGIGVVATGHSLGGAIAQIAACFYPDLVVSVVTFQSPGIPADVLARLRAQPAGERPTAHHHRVDGCVVDDAGETFLPGAVSVHGTGVDPVHAHTTFPLLSEPGAAREPWMRPSRQPAIFGPGIDPAVGATRRDVTTSDSLLDQARPLAGLGIADAARTHPTLTGALVGGAAGGERTGVPGAVGGAAIGGAAVGIAGSASGVFDDTARRAAYTRIWTIDVLPHAETGDLTMIDGVIRRRCVEEDIADQTDLMLRNYSELFPDLAAADEVVRELGANAPIPAEDDFLEDVQGRAGIGDGAASARLHRYWSALSTADRARGLHEMAPPATRVRDDAGHARGAAMAERMVHGGPAREPVPHAPAAHEPPPRAPMPHHGPHEMVAPDGGVIADLPTDEIHAHAAHGVTGAGDALPHQAAIQHAFGHHDVSGVQAHVGGAATDASDAIGARAYAYGDHVAFAGAPDLRQAAHEAAHVVQQRGGGVRLDGGVGRAGDVYEQHADDVAAAVVRGDSAEALLDTMAHRGAAGGPAVQRDPEPRPALLAAIAAAGESTQLDETIATLAALHPGRADRAHEYPVAIAGATHTVAGRDVTALLAAARRRHAHLGTGVWDERTTPRPGMTLRGHRILDNNAVTVGGVTFLIRRDDGYGVIYGGHNDAFLAAGQRLGAQLEADGHPFRAAAARGAPVLHEGGVGAINTYDGMVFTLGPGYAGHRLQTALAHVAERPAGAALGAASYLGGLRFNGDRAVKLDVDALAHIVNIVEQFAVDFAEAWILDMIGNDALVGGARAERTGDAVGGAVMPEVVGVAEYLHHGYGDYAGHPADRVAAAHAAHPDNASAQVAFLLRAYAERAAEDRTARPDTYADRMPRVISARLPHKVPDFIQAAQARDPSFRFDLAAAKAVARCINTSPPLEFTLSAPGGLYLDGDIDLGHGATEHRFVSFDP